MLTASCPEAHNRSREWLPYFVAVFICRCVFRFRVLQRQGVRLLRCIKTNLFCPVSIEVQRYPFRRPAHGSEDGVAPYRSLHLLRLKAVKVQG